MAEVINMPKLEVSMNEGKLIKWYKKEGDAVKKGEPLFSVETNKTRIDVEATGDGVVRKLLISEGDKVPVFQAIAIVGTADENIDDLMGQKSQDAPVASPEKEKPKAKPQEADTGHEYEVLIIGGGPGGYVAAIRSAQSGKKTAIIEKKYWGGTCLNVGCIPTKVFLRSIKALKDIKNADVFGIKGVDIAKVSMDMTAVQRRKQDIVAGLSGGVDILLEANGVAKIKGEASFLDAHTVMVGGNKVSADNIIVATGSESKSLPVPTSKKMKVMSSTEVLDLKQIPTSTVVIGGGAIGIEFAYFLANAGAKVTIVEFLDRILPMVDQEITKKAEDLLTKLGVEIFTGSSVKEITDHSVIFNNPEGIQCEVKTDLVLMSVGRQAMTAGLNYEKAAIKVEKGCIVTDGMMRTSTPNIYAIGDVNGKSMLAHVASMEAIIAVDNICGKEASMDYGKVPSVIYIEPEIACVGLTEAQARERYTDVKVGSFSMSGNGRAKVVGEERGVVKVIISGTYGEILGVHLFCENASDMIAEAVTAMKLEGTADEMVKAIHPHPTLSEAVQEAFNAAVGKAIHSI